MTQLNSHSFFSQPPRWGGKTSCGTSSAQKARSRFCKGKISPRICKGGATLGMWRFFWGRRGRCTGMICKGWVGFHKNILMLEVKLSLRSLLMVGRQYICHLEHLQNHGISYGISFSKHPLKLPNFPAQRHLYNTQFNMEKTHGTREGLSKNKGWSLVGSIDGSPFISQAPQRVVWLHHHSLANWDSNIRSSSEFDHNGLETDRPGRLAMFFWSKKIGSGDE